MVRLPKGKGPHILIYDIEIGPALGWFWGGRLYDVNILKVKQDWYMLSFSYKWFGDKRPTFVGIHQDPKFKPWSTNDEYVAKRLHALFDAADVTLAHNGDSFDTKKANSRFDLNGLGPPSPYQTIDPVKIYRKKFGHNSNKLNELSKMYGHDGKENHDGLETWFGYMAGIKKHIKTMKRYNDKDVEELERLYNRVLPWIDNHPNYGLWNNTDKPVCPNCGSHHVIRNGMRYNNTRAYQRWLCRGCGYSPTSTTQVGGSTTQLK